MLRKTQKDGEGDRGVCVENRSFKILNGKEKQKNANYFYLYR